MLSNTYVHSGKVYNKGIIYEVDGQRAKHLLAQHNERNVFYFRRAVDDGAQAHLAPKKSINKGGIPIPVVDDVTHDESEDDAKPDPADDAAPVTVVAEVDDDDAPKLDADGVPVDGDDSEEAITV